MTPLKECRKLSGKTVELASEELGVSPRQLHRYESGEIVPQPDIVIKMAEIYQAPALIRWFRAEVDPIGRQFETPLLNNVNRTPFARFSMLIKELREGQEAAQKIAILIINKQSGDDFSDAELAEFFEQYAQAVTDVKQAIAEAEEACMELFGVDVGLKAMDRHRHKMISRGYLKIKDIGTGAKRKPLASVAAEQRALYNY